MNAFLWFVKALALAVAQELGSKAQMWSCGVRALPKDFQEQRMFHFKISTHFWYSLSSHIEFVWKEATGIFLHLSFNSRRLFYARKVQPDLPAGAFLPDGRKRGLLFWGVPAELGISLQKPERFEKHIEVPKIWPTGSNRTFTFQIYKFSWLKGSSNMCPKTGRNQSVTTLQLQVKKTEILMENCRRAIGKLGHNSNLHEGQKSQMCWNFYKNFMNKHIRSHTHIIYILHNSPQHWAAELHASGSE